MNIGGNKTFGFWGLQAPFPKSRRGVWENVSELGQSQHSLPLITQCKHRVGSVILMCFQKTGTGTKVLYMLFELHRPYHWHQWKAYYRPFLCGVCGFRKLAQASRCTVRVVPTPQTVSLASLESARWWWGAWRKSSNSCSRSVLDIFGRRVSDQL